MPGLSVLSTFPRKSEMRLRQRLLRRSLPADRGTLGRLVCDRQERAGAAHGQPAADHAQADRRAAAGARVARRPVRSDRLPDAVQRHRRADGARSPGALQQSRDARHVGSAAWRRDAHRRSGRRRWPITCCSWTRRRSPAAASTARRGSRRSSRRAGTKDAKGRSLRELDLKTRLQKYPLSYMIYSPQFQALPEAPKNLVMGRINACCRARSPARSTRTSRREIRAAIREILQATF